VRARGATCSRNSIPGTCWLVPCGLASQPPPQCECPSSKGAAFQVRRAATGSSLRPHPPLSALPRDRACTAEGTPAAPLPPAGARCRQTHQRRRTCQACSSSRCDGCCNVRCSKRMPQQRPASLQWLVQRRSGQPRRIQQQSEQLLASQERAAIPFTHVPNSAMSAGTSSGHGFAANLANMPNTEQLHQTCNQCAAAHITHQRARYCWQIQRIGNAQLPHSCELSTVQGSLLPALLPLLAAAARTCKLDPPLSARQLQQGSRWRPHRPLQRPPAARRAGAEPCRRPWRLRLRLGTTDTPRVSCKLVAHGNQCQRMHGKRAIQHLPAPASPSWAPARCCATRPPLEQLVVACSSPGYGSRMHPCAIPSHDHLPGERVQLLQERIYRLGDRLMVVGEAHDSMSGRSDRWYVYIRTRKPLHTSCCQLLDAPRLTKAATHLLVHQRPIHPGHARRVEPRASGIDLVLYRFPLVHERL
jgi:hypothetical protein